MKKRFEVFQYDYLSIPDADDFSFSGGSIAFEISYSDEGRIQVEFIADIEKEIDEAFTVPAELLAGSKYQPTLIGIDFCHEDRDHG